MNPKPLWRPDPARMHHSAMADFIIRANAERGAQVTDYDYPALYRWSLDDPAGFWSLLWDFFNIKAEAPPEQILAHPEAMPGARWFTGARLNFAENLLRFRDEQTALVFRNESGCRRRLSYAELYREVASVRAGLEASGVGTLDRVAAYLPNLPEAVIVMLATASLGAVYSSASPDFGASGVLDRFGQIEPKVLFASDGYLYNGKPRGTLGKLRQIAAALPSLERVVVVPYVDSAARFGDIRHAVHYDDFRRHTIQTIEFRPQAFDHPLYILYSSGTTGKPKCIVHGTGGVLLQHLKELGLHCDLHREDVLFYFTTCGWMMWNWLVSGLALGATLVLYDGSPLHPDAEALLRMADEEGITVFGTSAKYLAAIEKAGVTRNPKARLDSIRSILSTGSPLLPEQYDYVYRELKPQIQLASISGGTDIVSCFALGNPLLPVYRGELQCRGLGMAVKIFDSQGHSLVGKPGELVCTRPFPAMPIGFWNDPNGERYRSAYFGRFPNVWHHGDWSALTERGGLIIYGRSDAVLNPGGVRIGTAEIYRQVEKLPEIMESLAVGQAWRGDVRIVLFVRLADGIELTAELGNRIRREIRDNASPRHVPAKIIAVPDLPRTRSGKITEIAVRKIIHGQEIHNLEALANPEALEAFRNRPELAID